MRFFKIMACVYERKSLHRLADKIDQRTGRDLVIPAGRKDLFLAFLQN